MWSQARKSYRSPERSSTMPQPFSATTLLTPFRTDKPPHNTSARHCPLHFNQPTHICLTCRKSICLRCALTYCHSHVVRSQADSMDELREELAKLKLFPKLEQIQLKLSQSKQRQQYLQKKALKLIEGIQKHFDYISEMLSKKKLQIIQYYDSQFQRYLQDHCNFDAQLKERAEWIRQFTSQQDLAKLTTIEEIEALSVQLKMGSLEDTKTEKRLTKIIMGKDKIKIEKMWSEEHLQKVLFQIENVGFKAETSKVQKRKKRVTTQNAADHQYHTIGFAKSNSNSRLPSGRKQPITPFG